jgi:type IV pilus assembly protein PilC
MPELKRQQPLPAVESSELGGRIRELLQEGIQGRRKMSSESVMDELGPEHIPLAERDILWRLRAVSRREVSMFTRELALLLGAGVPFIGALQSIGKRTLQVRMRQMIYGLGKSIENGTPFWRSLAQFPNFFPPLYVSTVRAGEVSGKLVDVLHKLADYTEGDYLLRRKVRNALIYPAVVCTVAIVIAVLLTTFVMPVFIQLFDDFELKLPLLTRLLIHAVRLLPHIWYLFLAVPAVVFVLYKLFIRTLPGRLLCDRVKLWLPIIGHLTGKVVAARFSRTLSILYHSGVPIIEAMSVMQDTVGNEVAALKIRHVRARIEEGHSLEEAFKNVHVFPPLLIDMLVIGEQSGRLDEVLPQIASIYEDELNIALSGIGALVEPLLILAMGIMVAIVFSAFFVPYISLLSSAAQM